MTEEQAATIVGQLDTVIVLLKFVLAFAVVSLVFDAADSRRRG